MKGVTFIKFADIALHVHVPLIRITLNLIVAVNISVRNLALFDNDSFYFL